MKFSDWLSEELETRHIRNKQLAEMTGINPSNISSITNGRNPTLATAERILDALGCEMIFREKEPANNLNIIRNCNRKQVSAVLCNLFTECDHCPVSARCDMGHNGFLDFLDEEVAKDGLYEGDIG